MNDQQNTHDIGQLARDAEALLFALGEPISHADLSKMLHVEGEVLSKVLEHLHGCMRDQCRGIVLINDGSVVGLRAAPESAHLIERVRKEEYSRDIGRAGLEVLAAVLYRGPLSRPQIDFIRGVNSSQTLRTLAMRGLVRKVQTGKEAPEGGRRGTILYEPTVELLAQMGVADVRDLPEFAQIQEKLAKLEEAEAAAKAAPSHESDIETQE